MVPRPRFPTLKNLAIALACGGAITAIAPLATPAALGIVSVAKADQIDEFRTTLARYGSFQSHARYGEIWVPAETTVPQGWHPYPPCHWVYDRNLGWYFDDRSEWGRIVHHYGRWAHEAGLGWVWVPGVEFSPGWVVWRTNESWVGWAPLPPEQDIREISAQGFNTDKHWIFMDARKFGTKCEGGTVIASSPQFPLLFTQTRLVTDVRFVGGIAVFVLPQSFVVNIVDINVGIFSPWTPCFFGGWFWNWNWLMNNIIINVNISAPRPVPQQCPQPINNNRPNPPLNSNPPPAPGGGLRFNPPGPAPRDAGPPRLTPDSGGGAPRLVPGSMPPMPGFAPGGPGKPTPTPGFVGPKPDRHADGGKPRVPGSGGHYTPPKPDKRPPSYSPPKPDRHADGGKPRNPGPGLTMPPKPEKRPHQSMPPAGHGRNGASLADVKPREMPRMNAGLRTNVPMQQAMPRMASRIRTNLPQMQQAGPAKMAAPSGGIRAHSSMGHGKPPMHAQPMGGGLKLIR